MKKLLTRGLLTLLPIFGTLATAQTPLSFSGTTRFAGDLSTALNETWNTLTAEGFRGVPTAMTSSSVTYLFSRGDQTIEITMHQTDTGILVMSKDSRSQLLANQLPHLHP